MNLDLNKHLQEPLEDLEARHPGITAVMQREGACDQRNINKRFERAICGRSIPMDDEGAAQLQEIVQRVLKEYHALIARMPSVLVEFFMAAEKKPYEGALPLRRILLRCDSETGKG